MLRIIFLSSPLFHLSVSHKINFAFIVGGPADKYCICAHMCFISKYFECCCSCYCGQFYGQYKKNINAVFNLHFELCYLQGILMLSDFHIISLNYIAPNVKKGQKKLDTIMCDTITEVITESFMG